MRQNRFSFKYQIVFILAIAAIVGYFIFPRSTFSAPLDNAKDTLSTSRLSYHAGVTGTISSGETTINIDTSSNPDNNTTHLFPGDTVCFADAGLNGCKGNVTYTVASIIDTDTFTITSTLSTALAATDNVIATSSATHTITFDTTASVVDGSVLIRIPANTNTATSNNGFADSGSDASSTQGFDLNSISASDITCSGGAPSWGAETVTASSGTGSGEHEIYCPFTGTLASGQTVTVTLGGPKLINPAPASDHTQGIANDLQLTIEEYDNNTPASGTLISSSDVAVAPIEQVFVSATVDETIAFSIAAVTTGGTACGISPSVTSTYNTIPFGTMALNTFKTMAHDLEVSTNASSGYAVTAIANDQMGMNGNVCTADAGVGDNCIPDTLCDGGACSHTAADDWETNTNNGFGYSLDSSDGTDAAFEWDGTSGTCDGAGTDFCAKQFADNENSQAVQTIMSNGSPVNSKNVYVCYRISVGATQPAGYYYNKITYVATPTF